MKMKSNKKIILSIIFVTIIAIWGYNNIDSDQCRSCPFANGAHLAKFLLDNSDGIDDPPALDAKALSVDDIVIFPTPPGTKALGGLFPGKELKLNEKPGESDGVFHIGLAKSDHYYVYAISTSDICWDPENGERCALGGKLESAAGFHVKKITIKSGNLIVEREE